MFFVLKLIFTLIIFTIRIGTPSVVLYPSLISIVLGQQPGTFPACDYYWPMTKTSYGVMQDVEEDGVEAELHGVTFIENKRFGDAISLSGPWSYIDVDAGILFNIETFITIKHIEPDIKHKANAKQNHLVKYCICKMLIFPSSLF